MQTFTRLRAARLARALPLVLVLAAGCRADRDPWTDERIAQLTLRERLAQMVAPVVETAAGTPAETDSALATELAAEGVGGVLLLPGAAEVAARRVRALQAAAPLPVLVAAPLDGGVGGTFGGGGELPHPAELATLPAPGSAALARGVAAEARALGVGLALLSAPPFPAPSFLPVPAEADGTEAFGRFVAELERAGLGVGIRAFAAPRGGDGSAPVLTWDAAAVGALQVAPLRRFLDAGASAVLPAEVALPALTRDSVLLPANPVLVQGVLRRDLGFDGVVVAELGEGSALVRAHGEGGAAVRTVAAGADLLLGVRGAREVIDSLVAAVEAGRISPRAVEGSVRRIFAAKSAAGLRPPAPPAEGPPPELRPPATALPSALPDEALLAAHRAALRVLGRPPAELLAPCRGVVVATAPGAGAATFAAALSEALPGVVVLETATLALAGPLVPPELPFPAPEAECVVAASFPHARLEAAERIVPADTTAAAGDTVPRRVVWVEFAPAPFATPPLAPTLVVAHGTGAAAQAVAAGAVTGRTELPPLPAGTAWPPTRFLREVPPGTVGMRGDSLASIDRVMRRALAEGVFAQAVVVVGRRGGIVRMTGYGELGGEAVDPRATLFDVASLTKVVGTTAAAMAAVDEGSLELDDPLRRHLPDFRGEERERVTLRQLLSHTSGLPAGAWLYGSARGPEEALRQIQGARIVTPPGERVVYSDFGMILVARAVEEATGAPLDAFLAERVFGPLGMASTQFLPPLELQPITVPTAARSERPYPLAGVVHDANAFRLGGIAGHAGLFSTGRDLAVFAQAMVDGGAYGSRRVFDPRTVAAFTALQAGAGTRALGWDTPGPVTSAGSYFSARSYGHTGFTGTSMWIDPERELFVIVLANRTFTEGGTEAILNLRARVADLAALSIDDEEIRPRPGSVAARRRR